MIPKMHAVDFNTWMTLIAMIRSAILTDTVKSIITVPSDNILPEYPRDLTKFNKPSIIIQRVASDVSDTCMGKGFIGQTYDDTQGAYIDIFSRHHEMEFQYDTFGDTNTQNALLEAIIVDNIMSIDTDGSRNMKIYDFVSDPNNPTEMGIAKIKQDIDVIPMNPNNSYDYRTAIRVYLDVIQTIIPAQEFVDLSKWIKISQTVTI